MTLGERVAYAFGAPDRTQPLRVWRWMAEQARGVTIREVQQQFRWSIPHTIVVFSRLPVSRLDARATHP